MPTGSNKAVKVFKKLRRYFKEQDMYVPSLGDPFRVLIATVISARTKDEVTKEASRKLFKKFPTPQALANADPKEVAKLIYPAGFYKTKAKRLVEIARIIVEEYDGKVPSSLEALLELPGVGRKTANIVLAYAFGVPAVPVDTHVHRISNRLGLVKTRTPEETERELKRILPKRYWIDINWMLVKFGQIICRPINPKCNECPLHELCDYPSSKQNSKS